MTPGDTLPSPHRQVSATSAAAHRLTVVGFLRGETMNVYSSPERVRAPRRPAAE